MKLISMTDFVLEQSLLSHKGSYNNMKFMADFHTKSINYATFLKQPLTLGMFVPCDEKGNFLKPETVYCMAKEGSEYFEKHKRYWEAKEKVLFKGFSIRTEKKKSFVGVLGYEIELPLEKFNMTIENLANQWDVELTESAIKQYLNDK